LEWPLLSDSYFDMSSDKYSDDLSGKCSDILLRHVYLAFYLTCWHPICSFLWHSIRHFIWHFIWHPTAKTEEVKRERNSLWVVWMLCYASQNCYIGITRFSSWKSSLSCRLDGSFPMPPTWTGHGLTVSNWLKYPPYTWWSSVFFQFTKSMAHLQLWPFSSYIFGYKGDYTFYKWG